MSTLVNHSGDDFYPGSLYANPTDASLMLALGPHLDVFCLPRKRSRISAPFIFRGNEFEKKEGVSIDVLPDECLFEIFRRLPGGQERSSAACVSKRWLMLLSGMRSTEICGSRSTDSLKPESDESSKHEKESTLPDSSKNEVDLESDGHLNRCLEGKKATDIRLAAISVGTSRRGGLGKLMIRGSNGTCGVTDLGLSAIAHGCPSLRVLSLWNVSSISDEGLSDIANGCQRLEKLDLCQCPQISDKGLVAIAKNCPKLTALAVESCPNIGNEGLQAIGKHCLSLQSISVKDCPAVGDQGVVSLLSSTIYVMTKVKLQGVGITDVSLAVLGYYGKAVTDVILTGLQNITERGFWVMGNANGLHKLRSLTVTSCQGVSDLGLDAVGKGCPNLKQLCLRRCPFLSDTGLISCTRTMISLECLQLEECNRVTLCAILGALSNCGAKLKVLSLVKCMGIDDMILALPMLSPCKSLRSLSIRHCPGFGSSSLSMVGNMCPQLEQIDLSGLSGVTDAGILSLLKSFGTGLVKVNISGCMNLTDAVVKAIATHHGGTLEVLTLDGCSMITDVSLLAIAQGCPVLRDLDISKSAVTDVGIAALSFAKQPDLQILCISGCSNVTDKSIPFLGKLGQTLVGLNLQQCKSISSRAIELLVSHLWRCDILS